MYKTHVFVCTNGSDKPGKCGNKNSEALRQELKQKCKGLPDVRINSSGCLGFCEKGIAAVIYPQAKWFFELTDADCEKLLQAVVTKK